MEHEAVTGRSLLAGWRRRLRGMDAVGEPPAWLFKGDVLRHAPEDEALELLREATCIAVGVMLAEQAGDPYAINASLEDVGPEMLGLGLSALCSLLITALVETTGKPASVIMKELVTQFGLS